MFASAPSAITSSALLGRYQRFVVLFLLGILTMLLIAASGLIIRQQSRLLEEAFVRRGVVTLQHLVEVSRDTLKAGDRQTLTEIVYVTKETDDDIQAAALFNAQGTLVAASGPDVVLPIETVQVPSVVSVRDYLVGQSRILVGPIRNKEGDVLGLAYLRLSRAKITQIAVEAAGKLDALIVAVFVVVGVFLNILLKRVKLLAGKETQHMQQLAQAYENLQKLQNQLVEAERLAALGQLASSMAHELRNPLGAIKNAVYYIRDALKPTPLMKEDPALVEFLDLTDQEIKSATRIISDLLDYSREMKLSRQPTDVHALLRQIRNGLEVPANIKIVEEFEPVSLPLVEVDPERLRQVFSNLVINALQAMPEGGELRLRTRLVGAQDAAPALLLIDFKDTGQGIAPEEVGKIFQPLYTTKAKGTGLGLPISLSIAKAHGGTIAMSSELGQGSCFTVQLPFNREAA